MYLPSFPVQAVIPDFTFPRFYSGSFGPHHFPTYSTAVFSLRSSVLRSAKTASAHLGAVRFRSLPNTLSLPFPFVSHRFRWLDAEQVRLARRQGSCCTGTPHLPALRLQGDSRLSQVRELPLYAHAPVADPGGASHACRLVRLRLLPSTSSNVSAFSARAEYPYGPPSCSIFGIQCRGLRTRFPSASHTPSRESHFGSATRLLATLWLGGIRTRWATSTDFNAYRHLPTFHVSLGTRATITDYEHEYKIVHRNRRP
jgi:hypothetical protein